MQVGDAVNNALRGMPFIHSAGAKTIAKGLGAKVFWQSKSQSLHPGAPAAIRSLKDLLSQAAFLKVRTVHVEAPRFTIGQL